jgi:hypothetical protein
MSRSGKLVVFSLCLAWLVSVSYAQRITNVAQVDSPYIKGAKPMFLAMPSRTLRPGEMPHAPQLQVPLWNGSFALAGQTYNFTMVGTDPALGSATTKVPMVIIPLALNFSDGTTLSVNQRACGDIRSPRFRVKNSPLLKNAPFTPGGTNVGTTQYIDAFQRANFWSTVSTTSPGYHVLFSPVTVEPLQTLVIGGAGTTVPGPCARIGLIDFSSFDVLVQGLLSSLAIPSNVLPVFLTYNTFEFSGSRCCVLGYHFVTGINQTYAEAAYSDPGIFNAPIQDVHALSHELGEWTDDPFVNNIVPPWTALGTAGDCSAFLEVGDPVTGNAFTVAMGGKAPFTYHPEDLVFLPWFARVLPSTSVNGWYSFLDAFASPQAVCQ